MSYFTSVPTYETYKNEQEDFHFAYNYNSGGGQAFLAGQFFDENGALVSSSVLNGSNCCFCFKLNGENNQGISILLDDPKGHYEIKPRSAGSTPVKLEIGTSKENPSKLISAFFMLPSTCGIKKPSNLNVSILTSNNYWLQSMWLKYEKLTPTGEIHFIPVDFIYCGGKKGTQGKERYFKLEAQKRVDDINFLFTYRNQLPDEIRTHIEFFAMLYSGQSSFAYDSCVENTEGIMSKLAKAYPDKYSGVEDPLPFLKMLVAKSFQKKASAQTRFVGHNQVIYYGAPGTGKSYKTNEIAKNHNTIRTTFHPDSDYSTFVGAYKPATNEGVRYGLDNSNTVIFKYPEGDMKGKPIIDRKIEYRFVKQAFMKAYIAAWKLFAESNIYTNTTDSTIIIDSGGADIWSIDDVEDTRLFYTKITRISIQKFAEAVKKSWKSLIESDDPDNYRPGTSEMYSAAACIWYRDHNSIGHTADECWTAIEMKLKEAERIESNPGGGQTYLISLEEDNVVIRSKARAWKETIQGYFSKENVPSRSSIQKGVAKMLRDYGGEFEEAWSKLKEETRKKNRDHKFDSWDLERIPLQYLVIEEINRGNCAQIFGDLFQLLDRNKGFSEYPIEADEDIRKCLLSEDLPQDPSFGKDGLLFTEVQKATINAAYNSDETPFHDVAEEIAQGKVLVLPPNLYIWATMNTSDQSLFPIDSAFKRRWDWKYVRICEGKKEDGTSLNYRISFSIPGENPVDVSWWEFVKAINSQIESATHSEDKKLGYFFCKPDKKANEEDQSNTIISAEAFVGKVVFYLWQDVFKDYGFKSDIFKRDNNKRIAFHDFYPDDMPINEKDNPEGIDLVLVKQFIEKVLSSATKAEQANKA